jgi:large subunit ribosomal protein L9
MEVILKKDVENLGFKDDVVSVKNGYGRNFLIPQGMAVMATPSAKKVLAENLRQRAHREAKVLEDAKKVGASIENMGIKITAKTADGTKLFGSVNSADVAAAIAAQGQEVESKFIKLDGNSVKRIGKYTAHIRLHRNLIVDLPFEVVAEAIASKAKAVKVEVTEVPVDENDAEESAE